MEEGLAGRCWSREREKGLERKEMAEERTVMGREGSGREHKDRTWVWGGEVLRVGDYADKPRRHEKI
jgi:hypothetical protein